MEADKLLEDTFRCGEKGDRRNCEDVAEGRVEGVVRPGVIPWLTELSICPYNLIEVLGSELECFAAGI